MTVLQWNAGRGLNMAGRVLLDRLADEQDALICMIQEPGHPLTSNWRWQAFSSGRACILVDRSLRASQMNKWCKTADERSDGLDIAAVIVATPGNKTPLHILSVYRDQSFPPSNALSTLRDILLSTHHTSTVAGGDLNIHCSSYGARTETAGGRSLANLIAELQSLGGDCCNSKEPTWVGRPSDGRDLRPSTIDYTLHTRGTKHPIHLHGWNVGDQVHSDHRSISFRICFPQNRTRPPPQATNTNTYCHAPRHKLDLDRLAAFSTIAEEIAAASHQEGNELPASIIGDIQSAGIEAGILRRGLRRQSNKKHRAYGWDTTCTDLFKTQRDARRAIHRADNPDDKDYWGSEWRKAHKLLKEQAIVEF